MSEETNERALDAVKDEDFGADQAFDDAFSQASEQGDRAELSPADNPENADKEEAEEKAPPEEKETAPEVKEAPEQKPPADSDETYEQRWKTLQGIHRHDKEAWEAEKVRLQSQLEELQKTPPAKEATPPKDDVVEFLDSLTPEQKEQLDQYEKDFDIISKMEGLKRETELKKLKSEFEKLISGLQTQLVEHFAPAMALAQTTEEREHFRTIREAHEDFEQYRDDGSIRAWISEKPKYLQETLNKVYSEGAAEDVISLLSDFKRERGITPESKTQPADNVVKMEKKAEKRQAMEAVTSRRGSINPTTSVADDYEGAFEEALNR